MKQTTDISDSTRDNKRIPNKENLTNLPSTSDITNKEVELLDETEFTSSTDDTDEIELRNEAVDKTDKDGELLNEESSGDEFSGSDLDVPGTEEDDDDEVIGEEDEENNIYSPAQK